MNIENILKVADAIEQASIPDLGFNMLDVHANGEFPDKTGRECGTTACIAGWALAVEGQPFHPFTVCQDATPFLGLTLKQANELYYAEDAFDTLLSEIEPHHAVRVLRILAITGKVDWAGAMDPREPELPALPVKAPVSTPA
jgi:hypothetical protein